MMILGKWRSPVENELKNTLLVEYKAIVAKLSECHGTIKHLTPRHDALAKLLETYGWAAEIEKLEADDDLKNNPEEAQSKGRKIEEWMYEFFSKNNNQWTKLSDLYVFLSEKGLRIGGKNPNSTLSAHLSNSQLFESDRMQGWRLKPEFVGVKHDKGDMRLRDLVEAPK
jgi:hypothetical protein